MSDDWHRSLKRIRRRVFNCYFGSAAALPPASALPLEGIAKCAELLGHIGRVIDTNRVAQLEVEFVKKVVGKPSRFVAMRWPRG